MSKIKPCPFCGKSVAIVISEAIYHHLPNKTMEECRAMLHDVPSAQPEQRWIACSERLPEKEGAYLICAETGYIWILGYAEGWNCFRDSDGTVDHDNEIQGILAWQPLPEPYEESGAEMRPST